MIERIGALLACLGLAGCGGGSGGVAFFGSVLVTPDETGAVTGVTELTEVSGAGGSFVYGYDTGLSARDFQDNATSSDSANYAYAGVVPGSILGPLPLTGTADFTGTYEAVLITGAEQSPDPSRWEETRDSGPVTMTVDFADGRVTGQSDDGLLRITRSETPTLDPAESSFFSGFDGEVRYRGISGSFAGDIGQNGAVAAMTGESATGFFAGGFVADVE